MRTDEGLGNSPQGELARSLGEMRASSQGFAGDLAELTKQMREMDAGAQRLARSLGGSLRSAIDKAIFGGAKLGDVLRDLASDVASRTLNAALRPVQNALGSGVSSAVGSLAGAVGGLFGFAGGGAFSAGRVRAFARGGVVDGPTLFPMRRGMGLMGEAGPEAVMPLTRGPDGRLGVRAEGGGGARSIVVNIETPDVEGFRRSRAQIAAQIARASAQGQRRL
ncbi:MAG: phage tail tape measure protein [Pseudomonadota bacterium]